MEGRYQVIYKKGDDLRQDQVVVQIFSLMDRLLKRENLDLKLTPYRWSFWSCTLPLADLSAAVHRKTQTFSEDCATFLELAHNDES